MDQSGQIRSLLMSQGHKHFYLYLLCIATTCALSLQEVFAVFEASRYSLVKNDVSFGEAMFRKAVTILKHCVGDDHPDTQRAMKELVAMESKSASSWKENLARARAASVDASSARRGADSRAYSAAICGSSTFRCC